MKTWNNEQTIATNNKMEDAAKFLAGVLGDISKRSAYTQIAIGAGSGWLTGFTTMKLGKAAAFAIGSGIILLEIAHHEGYVTIDWSKVSRSLDKVTDKVDKAVTGADKSWTDKAERYVDRKLDRAEDLIKAKSQNAKRWYSKLVGDENGPKINELHLFLTAFIGGLSLGFATA